MLSFGTCKNRTAASFVAWSGKTEEVVCTNIAASRCKT